MTQCPRWIPNNRTLVEVTARTFQGRYFLKPTAETRNIVLGVIGRAQRIFRMEICLLVFMSNHYHALLVPSDAEQLSQFMNYVNGEIGRRILPLTNWEGNFWGRRYDMVVVTDEPAAQRARFAYLASHGVKEQLVERPEQWIGANGVAAWLEGKPLKGYWFDKTREGRARKLVRNRGKVFGPLDFADEETVVQSPLPCWRAEGLTPEAIRREIEEMIERIVDRARLEREVAGHRGVLGTAAVLAKPREYRPEPITKRPRPLLHFRSRKVFEIWKGAFREFVVAYRSASLALRAGRTGVRFPERCFPPAAAFTFDGYL